MASVRSFYCFLRTINHNTYKTIHATITFHARSYSKTALITGGTKGIGSRALEELMAFKQMKFIITTRNVSEAETIMNANESFDEKRIDIIELDITKEKSINTALKHIESNCDKIDILINNALVSGKGFSEQNIDQTFETNYFGNINLTNAVLPYLSTFDNCDKTKNSKDLSSVYASRIIFPFNRECALNQCSKAIQSELTKDGLTINELNALMDRFKTDCIDKKWDNFGWIMNVSAMSIVGLNMFAKIYGNQMLETQNNNHWIGSFCIDNHNSLTQNGSGLCKLSTMLIDNEDRDKNGCLWGAFWKTATNIDVDDDDYYVDDVELQALDWINPSNSISWATLLDDMMFSNVSPEDQ